MQHNRPLLAVTFQLPFSIVPHIQAVRSNFSDAATATGIPNWKKTGSDAVGMIPARVWNGINWRTLACHGIIPPLSVCVLHTNSGLGECIPAAPTNVRWILTFFRRSVSWNACHVGLKDICHLYLTKIYLYQWAESNIYSDEYISYHFNI